MTESAEDGGAQAPPASDDPVRTLARRRFMLGRRRARRALLTMIVPASSVSATAIEHFSSPVFDDLHPGWGMAFALGIGLVFGLMVLWLDRRLPEQARIAERALGVAGDGYLIVDEYGRIEEVNNAYCALTGQSRAQLLGNGISVLNAIDGAAVIYRRLQVARANGVLRFETIHHSTSGEIPVRITITWIDEERHFVLIVRDRSATLAVEHALRERNELLMRVLDATSEGIYGVDAQGRCTFVNARALAILGYEGEDQVLGRDMHRLVHCGAASGVAPALLHSAHRALRGEQTLDGVHGVLWRSDATPIQVIYRACPIFAPDGTQVVGAVVSFTDCSAEERLRSTAERDRGLLSAVVDAMGEALILLDEHTRIARFNAGAERIFGLAACEAIDAPVDKLLWGCSGQELIAHVCAHAARHEGADPQPCTRLLEGARNDGSVFPMRVSLGLVHGPDGTWVALAIQDISDEIEAEAARRRNLALETQAGERRRFLSRMSHELRTPLNAVLGFTQLLHQQCESMTPNQRRAIERIEIAGQHLLGMVNDLMDLSKLDLGGIHIEARAFDVVEEWPQAVTIVLPMARTRGITIHTPRYDGAQTSLWRESGGLQPLANAWVKADPMRVRQILVNLMTNAIKYNRDGGAMSIEVCETADLAQISVVDTGQGLTPAQIEHIGEPFNRLGAEQSGIEGSGLGLALSRNLAQAMGGDLIIESAVGLGTRATLVLPRAAAPEARSGDSADAAAGTLAHDSCIGFHLLHVEDDPINGELVAELLAINRPGIAYVHVGSAAQALDHLRSHTPDVILTDMSLGDMSGLQLLVAIRATVHGARIPIVALSGDAMTESVSAALDAGLFAYLTKPIEFTRLFETLDAAAECARTAATG